MVKIRWNRVKWSLLVALFGWGLVLFPMFGCGSPEDVPVVVDGAVDLLVVYDGKAGVGVKEAAEEMVRALSTLTGKTLPPAKALNEKTDLNSLTQAQIIVLGRGILSSEPIEDADINDSVGDEGFVLYGSRLGGKVVLQVGASNATGVQYGAYTLLRRWGVRYFHPVDTYTPVDSSITLSIGTKETILPQYKYRGFHHHTQHPIPMSVYMLEPGDKNLEKVREYMRWLVRNRQNILQCHFLKTVDVDKWLPYAKKMVEMGKPYGVRVGLTISFADQQQNNYRLLDTLKMSDADQTKAIKERLDKLASAGLAHFVVQFGTSEFTKVPDKVAVRWLDTAAEHLKSKGIPVYAWIHTAGELKADDGKSYYYHLIEKSKTSMGAFLHTTMFYDMKNPAPVYGNEDFTHQAKLLDRMNGKRPIIYFPETAWWLGFDNNLPLAMPITGYSRALDILEVMKGKKVEGHVTFTTGMEWGYWKYDHYLTQVTWDQKTTWEEYVQDFSKIFGKASETVTSVLNDWTKLQVRDFYGKNPRMIFYLSGELVQDEIGASAGVLARSPKRPYIEIINLKDEDFKKWEEGDFATLQKMEKDYEALFKKLPKTLDGVTNKMALKLYKELTTTLEVYVLRVKHTVLLYDAVRDGRKGRADGGVGASASDKDKAQKDAKAKVEKAKAITQSVLEKIRDFEKTIYRYPADILITKRKSLTSYKFGYLEDTSRGYFWTRRDVQADKLLKRVFGEIKEEWDKPAPALTFQVLGKDVKLTKPDNALISSTLGSFIPGFVIGVPKENQPDGEVKEAWRMAADNNENARPDNDTAIKLDKGQIKGDTFTGEAKLFTFVVQDSAGNELGTLALNDLKVSFKLKKNGDKLEGIENGKIVCTVLVENIVTIATRIDGLERKGLLEILGSILGFDPKNPPRDFEFEIAFNQFSLVK